MTINDICEVIADTTFIPLYYGCTCHRGVARFRVTDRRYGFQIWKAAANILNKKSQTDRKWWSSS